jgi:hypothetical protein
MARETLSLPLNRLLPDFQTVTQSTPVIVTASEQTDSFKSQYCLEEPRDGPSTHTDTQTHKSSLNSRASQDAMHTCSHNFMSCSYQRLMQSYLLQRAAGIFLRQVRNRLLRTFIRSVGERYDRRIHASGPSSGRGRW